MDIALRRPGRIEAATVKAVELAENEELDPADAPAQAMQRVRPSTADIEFMTLLSVAECNETALCSGGCATCRSPQRQARTVMRKEDAPGKSILLGLLSVSGCAG